MKDTDDWPAGSVTEAGAISRSAGLLDKVTGNATEESPLRVTVAVIACEP